MWGRTLCLKALEKMSDEYSIYREELNAGIVKRVVPGLGSIPYYYGFVYDTSVSKMFERCSDQNFVLKGFMLSNKSGADASLSVYFARGLISGFSIKEKIDLTDMQVNIGKVRKCLICEHLPKELRSIHNKHPQINKSDIYMVEFGGRSIYHLLDIGDGDFIGYEMENGFVKVCHDPVSIYTVSDLDEYL